MPKKSTAWSAERLARHRATMAAKAAARNNSVQSIPLDAIPARPVAAAKPAAPVKKPLPPRLQLIADIVRLLLAALDSEK